MAFPEVAILAGTVSTFLFVVSYLPMLVKAYRSKDLASYSVSNLLLANVGNGVHSVYVFSLPAGPLWALHTFYVVSSAVMLFWWWRYRSRGRTRGNTGEGTRVGRSTDSTGQRFSAEHDVHAMHTGSGRIDLGLAGSDAGQRANRPGTRGGVEAEVPGRRAHHLGGELAGGVEQPDERALHRRAFGENPALQDRLVDCIDAGR